MKRAWIGVALLATSWLVGLNYYYGANWVCWAALVVIGASLFGGVAERLPGRLESAVAMLLVLPALWLAPWPYRAAPLLIVIGLLPTVAGLGHRPTRRVCLGATVAGLVLLAQGLAMLLYAHWTERSHELPAPLTALLAGVAHLLGIESTVDENNIVMLTMRKYVRLGSTWELFLDPPTFCFLIGGFALAAIRVGSSLSPGGRIREWAASVGRLLAAVMVWLPVRSGLMMALVLHRALRTDFEAPLKVLGQFWDPWVQLVMLCGPVLLAWRFVFPRRSVAPAVLAAPADAASAERGTRWIWRAAASVAAAAAVALFVAGQFWDPPGERKAGRVAIDEAHSDWERTDRPMDTEWYGQMSGYNYYCIYDYLSRFYDMSRLVKEPIDDATEANYKKQHIDVTRLKGPIDEATLANLDVLIVKTPTARYSPDEVAAIEQFVNRGGGLMLIGEHTDVFRTGEFLNEISQNFGFTFRYDVLFRASAFPYEPALFAADSPFEELYVRPLLAHPITQRMPPLDFEISCSVDPGSSSGQAVMTETGLWNLPPDYFALNYYPQVEDRADARYGAWIQTWATRHGKGRVVAFTDSTQFSNFSTFEPGKPEVMMGMVEWLNHDGGFTAANWLLVVGAAALAVVALLLARRWADGWLALAAAGVFGWCVAACWIRAAHTAELPMPPVARPMVAVTMDRTISDAPLSKGGFIGGRDDAFCIFERNMLRLGYFTHRGSGADALGGNLLVVLNPHLDVPPSFRDAVVEFVKKGGKLVVLDSPQNAISSTANNLLFPLGMAVDHQTNFNGTVSFPPGASIPIASACAVRGGEPLLSFDGSPTPGEKPPVVAATRRVGEGSVTVIGFSSRFTDANMGVTGETVPDPELRKVFNLEYGLLRGIVDTGSTPPGADNSAEKGASENRGEANTRP